MTKPKVEGSLGIQSAKGRNQALLSKLNWRFRIEKDALWAKVLKSKYCSSRKLNARNRDKLPCSRVWKAMKKGGEVFNKGVRWIPGRNSNLSLWRDNWATYGPLRALIQGPLTTEEECLKVKDVFGPQGWDWSILFVQLPNSVLDYGLHVLYIHFFVVFNFLGDLIS